MTLLDLAVALWQGESVAPVVPHAAFLACHPERSEGSGSMLIIHVVTSLVPECQALSPNVYKDIRTVLSMTQV